MSNLATQIPLRPVLPQVLNNVDYHRREQELRRMDELLRLSGAEQEVQAAYMAKWLGEKPESIFGADQILKQEARSRRALRCVILMSMFSESYREMSVRLAECPLYQWFCELDHLGGIMVPSKSELGRFVKIVDASVLRDVNDQLIAMAAKPGTEDTDQVLGLKNEIELSTVWMDSTALKANIHFPVDWVLLRDATVTLMKATDLIRKHGIKHRMAEPKGFIKAMNSLSMQMTSVRRKPDSKRSRKKVFRSMKKVIQTVKEHALRHRDLLEKGWQETDWSEAQAAQVIGRIDNVIGQLPEAIKQGHERIIGNRKVKNSEKILSLYESEVDVIVRGKASAEIEFGNSLLLAEQKQGLIVDWKLHQQSAPNDSNQVQECVERVEASQGKGVVEAVVGDRQFESKANKKWLETQGIYNALCPRSVEELKNKSKSAKFQELQRRRAQTEARIAILKNEFLGNPLKRKGFKNRERQVGWSVLAHNLWVLARLEVADEISEPLAAAA